MNTRVAILMALTLAALLPAAAYGQASIVGTVRDTSNAVLPGVTVEASSPALIEKVRTAVTDGAGQFQVVDLRPGAYIVTFSLPGFSTVRREGIEISGSIAVTVNAELRLGALEETITVTGETPVVDVTTTRLQQTMDRDVIDAIPSARQYFNLANLVPSISNGNRDVGGSSGVVAGAVIASGSRAQDSRILIDGMNVAIGAGGSQYMTPTATSRELTFNVTGGAAESDSPGFSVSIVPLDGGNSFGGSLFANGANSAMVGDNLSDELRAQGLQASNKLVSVYDLTAAFGGPLVRDRLWFYGSARGVGNNNTVAGMYVNKNAGNVNAWTFEPDYSRQAETEQTYRGGTMRLTWQATPRNKFSGFWDEQYRCAACEGGGTAVQTIEATPRSATSPMRLAQATWKSPVSNRMLAEAGFSLFGHRTVAGNVVLGGRPRTDGTRDPDLMRVVEQAGLIPGLSYRQPTLYGHHWTQTTVWRGALSYITGSHSAKVGYDGGLNRRILEYESDTGLWYRFNNGVPNQLTLHATPYDVPSNATTAAMYVQDQWVLGRLTLQGGIRYDFLHTTYPAQQLGPSTYYPNVVSFPASDSYRWNDVTPRFGAAYDLFGNGKTAVKVMAGKYVSLGGLSPGGADPDDFTPVQRMATSTARAWTDANGNFTPDCDLASGAAQDLRASGGDLCGAYANANYGTANFSSNFNPDYVQGWGVRPYQWVFTPSIQQQLWPRVSLTVGYVRRVSGNVAVTDNLAVGASDFDRFSITAPSDPRLPGGGGYTVPGLYNVKPEKFGLTNDYRTLANDYGTLIQHYDGINAGVNMRLSALTVQGGLAAEKTTTDNCEVVEKVPELLQVGGVWLPDAYCHIATPFLMNYKGLATYIIPRVDVQVSGTYQNLAGAEFAANYNAPNAVIIPGLGRPLAGNAPNLPVNIIEPAAQYGQRYMQVDLRAGKMLTVAGARLLVAFDLYNAFNANPIQTYNNTYVANGPWLTPTLIEPPRVAKFSVQLDF
jgi:hypothetical protein